MGRLSIILTRILDAGLFGRRPVAPPEPPTPAEPPAPREPPAAPDWVPPVQDAPASSVHLAPKWYLERHSEAAAAIAAGTHADAVEHYLRDGATRGLDPNPVFSERFYLETNPEVAASVASGRYLSGFQHFVLDGVREGRHCLELEVDERWYLQTYPDAARLVAEGAVANAFTHYLTIGAEQARDPHAAFDEIWYRRRVPEVAAEIAAGRLLSGYQHFRKGEPGRGALPHPAFSERFYRKAHPEVARAVDAGEHPSGYLHLVRCGLAENRLWRRPTPLRHLADLSRRLARLDLTAFLAEHRRLAISRADEPEVSVVVVLFNQAELTLRCLESLSRVTDPRIEVIVVDNGSTDATGTVLDRLDGVTVLRNRDNLGFLAGSNQGAAAARAPHLLLLNNDAVPLPGAIRSALDRLRGEPHLGAVGGCLVRPDGLLQEAGAFLWRDGSIEAYGAGDHPLGGAYRFPREVDYGSGAFLLVRTDAFRSLGGFDGAFAPGYYEDVDLCLRLRRQLGLATLYDPGAIVHHLGSGSETSAQRTEDLARRNRLLLLERHRAELAERPAYDPAVVVRASRRGDFPARVLVLDDLAPVEHLGSGAPRMARILDALARLGAFVTLVVANPRPIDRPPEGGILTPANLEVVDHVGRDGLVEVLAGRHQLYSHVIVSRLHNLAWWLARGLRLGGARLVYDAEAVVADRVAEQLRLVGALPPGLEPVTADEELQLVARADEVWAVSEADAETLRVAGRPVRIVAHAEPARTDPPGFAGRRDLVFVGRLREEGSPNVDGLRWFGREVLPEIRRLAGSDVRLRVVGEIGDVDLGGCEGFELLGPVDDLGPVLDRALVLVAPVRFAAGIPLKVVTAAAHGLPAVASSLLVRQLGWHDQVEILDGGSDPATFAAAVVAALADRPAWERVQRGALARVRTSFAPAALRSAIAESLGLDG